jgi:hypothetical protein
MPLFLSFLTVLSAIFTGFLYWLGLAKFLFWYHPWFDVPVHLAGGLTIGLWAVTLAWPRGYSRYQTFFLVILFALTVGLVWEIFEYVNGITAGEAGYWLDTFKDLGDDVGGALVGWVIFCLLYITRSKQE